MFDHFSPYATLSYGMYLMNWDSILYIPWLHWRVGYSTGLRIGMKFFKV